MKNLTLATFILLSGLFILGPGKVSAQEKPPTKAELEKMMKELDPEELEMMKKMGIDVSLLSKMDLSEAYDEDEEEDFPIRDEVRIAQAKKTTLKSTELVPYLEKVNAAVFSRFGSKASTNARELFTLAGSTAEKAQLANGLWMFGSTAYAILVLGNTLQSDPNNPDYLNNYAAFLTMAGAEEAALPILKYLNASYPKNSTILNNMAQALFGLGDIPAAEAYIDSTLMLYPGHSQANLTKSVIEEKKGNKTEAAKALKESIKSGYSPEKEKKIKDFGHRISPNDLTFYPPLNEDPMGLVHMNWPKYPKNVSESQALEKEWIAYREGISMMSDKIYSRMDVLSERLEEQMDKQTESFGPIGQNADGSITQLIFSPKIQALREYYEGENGELEYQKYNEVVEAGYDLQEKALEIEEDFENKMAELVESMGDRIGEGSSNADLVAYCNAVNALKSNYLQKINTLLEAGNIESIDYWKKTLSWKMNYYQFTLMPDQFEWEKLKAHGIWLGMISGQEVRFTNPCIYVDDEEEEEAETGELADFYDMTCTQKSVLNLGVGTITIECNKMTTKLDSKFFKYTVKENMDTDQIIRGSVEFGFDADLAEPAKWGPVKAELKGEIYGFVEFDSNGITDGGVKVGAKAGASTNLVSDSNSKTSLGFADDQSSTLVGGEARWGWNSGASMEGKGILKGLSNQ
jgi:tetratricopeptide (TPR) repeat protein